jgi:hypothetical protein
MVVGTERPKNNVSRQVNPALKTKADLREGDLIIYPFLWSWQSERGIVSGAKMRPCVVLMRDETEFGPMVALLSLSTKPPEPWQDRIEVPLDECLRVGMDPQRKATICLNDYNIDYIDTSVNLRHNVPIRSFSLPFVQKIISDFQEVLADRRTSQVLRVQEQPKLHGNEDFAL